MHVGLLASFGPARVLQAKASANIFLGQTEASGPLCSATSRNSMWRVYALKIPMLP